MRKITYSREIFENFYNFIAQDYPYKSSDARINEIIVVNCLDGRDARGDFDGIARLNEIVNGEYEQTDCSDWASVARMFKIFMDKK